MGSSYTYGCEINHTLNLLAPEDEENLQVFSCGNERLDYYIKSEVFQDDNFSYGDGRHYKVVTDSDEIIAYVSLASSGIIHQQGNYVHILPAVKIDVIALDEKYQHMRYDEEDDHYYLSDDILADVILKIREINDQILIKYIILYAEKTKVHFYERNMFETFESFMSPEHNQEINKNVPMYMEL